MLSEYEYAQKVMEAAGVKPSSSTCGVCGCPENYHWPENWGRRCTGVAMCPCSGYKHKAIYPDPLTSGDAFLALWNALVVKDFLVRAIAWNTSAGEKSTFICIEGENWRADSDNEDIKVALVEAAGQALGVSRG